MKVSNHPTFVIAGAPKSGTTSLYRYLAQHPRVRLSEPKEPRFHAFDGSFPPFTGPGDDKWMSDMVVTPESYLRLFQGAHQDQITGEASTDYLYLSHSFEHMYKWNPETRIIVMLRDPIHRSYSNYLHLRRVGFETLSFGSALAEEPRRIAEGWAPWWHYQSRGLYGRQLRHALNRFPPSQIHVELFQDLTYCPLAVMRRVEAFLSLEGHQFDLREVHNAALVPRGDSTRRLRQLVGSIGIHKRLPKSIERPLRTKFDQLTTRRPPLPFDQVPAMRQAFDEDHAVLLATLTELLATNPHLEGRIGGTLWTDSTGDSRT